MATKKTAAKGKGKVFTAQEINEVVEALDQSLDQMRQMIKSVDSLKECALELANATTERQQKIVLRAVFFEIKKLAELGAPIPMDEIAEMEKQADL